MGDEVEAMQMNSVKDVGGSVLLWVAGVSGVCWIASPVKTAAPRRLF